MPDMQSERREAFLKTFETVANLDEWVESYFDAPGELLWLASLTELFAEDIVKMEDQPLSHHWKYREVYRQFRDEVWAAAADLAYDYELPNVVKMLAYLEDDEQIISHETFVNTLVVRAIAKVAADLAGV